MIVCLCHRISDHDIRRAVEEGAHDFESLQEDTGLARNCACCHDCARELFDEARAAVSKPVSVTAGGPAIAKPLAHVA